MRALCCTIACAIACTSPATEPWSDAWILDETEAYLDDPAFRRMAVLESLRNHDNIYSTQRVASYGLDVRGWDALPEWNPRTIAMNDATVDALRAGALPAPDDALWDGVRPTTMDAWVTLGREVFFRYPLRSDPYVRWALANPSVAEAFLVRADGTYPGAVLFRDVDGSLDVGITCALCHTALRDGALVLGAARRAFDYGELRARFHDETGAPIDAELLRRMRTWGPGRADITEDEGEDPVAIPDLWGLRHQSALTHAGTIVHERPSALAIRQETQLLHANGSRARPPRELSWALAMFLYSLEPPTTPTPSENTRGRALFERHCDTCHDNAAYGGDVVDAILVGTDPALANGAARGTGFYRPAALLDVRNAAPYFHDASVPTLEDVLSRERLEPTYDRRPHGEGPALGHLYGLDLDPEAKRDLLAYLRSL